MKPVNRAIISGTQILSEQTWQQDYALVVEEDKIRAVIPSSMVHHHLPAKRYEFDGAYLLPGFIDIHVHGAGGHDVMDARLESFEVISHKLAAEGVTGYLATTMTAEQSQLEAVFSLIPQAMQAKHDAKLLGVHLEGPFISPEKAGAQMARYVRKPDVALFQAWQALSKNHIKLMTLAPELPQAIELIKAAIATGVVVSIGHTEASYAETRAAIAAGCSQATHLFNAMRGMHQRDPGAAGALLLSPMITAELIADGIHVHPAMIELAWRLKQVNGLVLVTDAMRAKCMGDGRYELGGQTVTVHNGRATLETGQLAGSTLRMPEAIKNIMQFTGCSLQQAISLASHNPARILGLLDYTGRIDMGLAADLVVMSKEGKILLTLCDGREVFAG